jgi:HK97 family phage major capsid protein
MADPFVDSTDFAGITVPPSVVDFISNQSVTGAPFARALTLLPTDRGSVAFPTVDPSAFDWTMEGQPLPRVDLGDLGPIVVACKLAGLVALTNELLNDNVLPISDLLGKAIAASMGPKLDDGLLNGSGLPAPAGILRTIPAAASEPDFRQAVIGAWGELVDEGADATQIVAFASATVVAKELARVSEVTDMPIHEDGADAMIGPGIRLIPVPTLTATEIVVADASAVYLVQRDDFRVDASRDYLFGADQLALRILGRFGIACPTTEKSMRRADILDFTS